MKAVDFNLPDESGNIHKLVDYAGKNLILYFYPKDDTPGCTKEACGFRDALSEIKKTGAVVLGISKDTPASHKKFIDKYHLTFSLLSDENKETIKAYNAWGKKKFLGKEFEGILRKTYLINKKGEIVKVYENVNPIDHANQILKDLKTLIL
jgi:peroxiredoxin Q/BCP